VIVADPRMPGRCIAYTGFLPSACLTACRVRQVTRRTADAATAAYMHRGMKSDKETT
jgi:hypothetical protein